MTVQPSPEVREMDPYEASDSATLSSSEKASKIKLDWNELTVPPSPVVEERLHEAVDSTHSEFYPDISASKLREQISSYVGLPSEYLQVFSGSDGAIRDIIDTYVGSEDDVLIREPTYTQPYTFFQKNCASMSTFTGETPFSEEIDTYLYRFENNNFKVVYLPNPNSPTGTLYTSSQIERLLDAVPETLFIIDEAYFEFTGQTAVGLINDYDNIVITRSFSKAFGLAAHRIGYIVSNPAIIDQVNKVRNGKNVPVLSQVAASAALTDVEYTMERVDEVTNARSWFVEKLAQAGIQYHQTPANFVLVKTAQPDQVVQCLRSRDIYVRDRSYLPQLSGYIRVSVGIKEQMKRFIDEFITVHKKFNQ